MIKSCGNYLSFSNDYYKAMTQCHVAAHHFVLDELDNFKDTEFAISRLS